MTRKTLRYFSLLAGIVLIYIGFKFVTQSGLQGVEGSLQNDGYAGTGGVLIMLGGMLIGYMAEKKRK